MIRRRITIDKILKRLTEYETTLDKGGGRERYIGGFKIKVGAIDASDPAFKAYLLQRGYQNFFQAIGKMGIPVMTIYASMDKGGSMVSGIYILTKARDMDELEERMRIIEGTFYAVFPTFQSSRLSGREIKNILTFGNLPGNKENNSYPMLIHEHPEPSESIGRDIPKFYIPVMERVNGLENSIALGYFIDPGYNGERMKYYITPRELGSHLFCMGITGSGKSTTIATILNQLPKTIKYLVLDFHNEYGEYLSNIDIVLRPGKDNEAAVNPLDPMFSIDMAEHIALVSDIFGDTYNFTHPQTYMFKMAMEATLSSYKALNEEEPNLRALVKMIERYPVRSYYDNETKMALLRRIKPLVEGQAEKAFIAKNYIRVNDLMEKNVVIELGHIRETKIRQIYSQILLKQIYDYKISIGTSSLNHITVIEEARYIVPYRRDYDPPTIAERMINELRKFGESVFLVTQFPTQVSKDTIKNAGMVILHRVVGQEDLKMILNIMSLDEKQVNYIKEMETGEAVIKDARYPLPIHVKILPKLP